jgi:hypothetical protein
MTAIAGAPKKGSRIRLRRGSESMATIMPSDPSTGGRKLAKGAANYRGGAWVGF